MASVVAGGASAAVVLWLLVIRGVDGGSAAGVAAVLLPLLRVGAGLDGAGGEAGAGDDALLGAVEEDAEGLFGC